MSAPAARRGRIGSSCKRRNDSRPESRCKAAAIGRVVGRGDQAAVLFIVQRPDARAFGANTEADPAFAQTLRRAMAAGVTVLACRCHVSEEEITLETFIPVEQYGLG